MRVLMIYPRFPEETFWNTARSARVFMHRKGEMPPLGLLTMASHLPRDFEVRLIDRNLAQESRADWEWADVVFLSAMLAQRGDCESCIDTARELGKPVALGGPLTHAMPEELLERVDWICVGEAESIMEELVGDIRAGRRGGRYQGDATSMERVRLPRFDLIPDLNDYAVMPIQFSRGCPFQCEFCDIIEIYGRVPRTKTPGQVLSELDALQKRGFGGYVFLVDDNFIGNKKKAKELLNELAGWNRRSGYPFAYFTEASINLADDPQLLEGMSEAGFRRVFIGIETPDPKLLKTTLKPQNIPGDPLEKLRRLRERGIHVTAGFIVGFDGEDRTVFETQQAFIRASGIGVAIPGLLQALPGTQLSRRLQREGRLLDARVSLISTVEGINFIPRGEMTKREYLERYRAFVKGLFDPEGYFERIVPAVLALRGLSLRTLSRVLRKHVAVLPRLCYHLGVRKRGSRIHFWKALLRVLWKNPSALEAFGHDCYYFDHLNRHAAFVDAALSAYLSAPPPGDVLDQVVRDPRRANIAVA